MNKTLQIIFVLLSFIGGIIFSACGNNTSKDLNEKNPDSSSAPLENRAANADFKPAFEGQTRIGGIITKTPYTVKKISSELNRPWGIVSLPDGRFLVTEKEGSMRIISMDGKPGEKIKGIPVVNSKGQGGLLGLTLHPDFKNNRQIFWTFSEKLQEGNLTSVAKGKLSADAKTMTDVKIIYRATPAYESNLHYGSRILFDKTGNIVFSTGERSDKETRSQAQSLKSSLGKIIRITPDGKPAPGNPFSNNKEARPEIYSYGHRNVQGLALHPVTGDLWENEFGPRGGDELNLIRPGKNYGWPEISYGIEYSGSEIGSGIAIKDGMEQPVYYWDPVLSPSGMTFYTGSLIPEWKNNLFLCGLNSNHISRLTIVNNKVTGEERLLTDEGKRFRDITQGKDGALYVVTDEGDLYRIGK